MTNISISSDIEKEGNQDRQTDLIAEFMHELKTRLMAVTAAGELLGREELDQRQRDLLNLIQKETVRLSKMAQDFLELARLDAGRVSFAREPVDAGSLLDDVAKLYEPQSQARGISFKYDPLNEPATILGDYDRLKKMLINLISNAIKYIDRGAEVTLTGRIAGDEVALSVIDNGPGIDAKSLPHIFDRFYRVPDSEGFTEGSGLGLSIASRIAQEHDGRIEVKSKVGEGSNFTCYLPRNTD